jgi:hypothetical protein
MQDDSQQHEADFNECLLVRNDSAPRLFWRPNELRPLQNPLMRD